MDSVEILKKYTTPVRLSHQNPIFTVNDAEAANKTETWHKFIIFDIKDYSEKKPVLDALIEFCTPDLLIPVMFKLEAGNKATFLSACQAPLIKRLIDKKLQLKTKTGKLFKFDIVLCFLSFKDINLNPMNVISDFLKIRIQSDIAKKCLNLSNFEKSKRLRSVYCPLSIPIMFETILHLAKLIVFPKNRDARLPIRELILQNNSIYRIQLTEKYHLFTYHLTKLDVRNNEINNIRDLEFFSAFQITELWLDGNPICKKYQSPKDYITDVKNVFIHIQILDGIVLGNEQKVTPIYHQHFLVDKSKKSLVQQFVEHFFTLYDQKDRIVLNGLYDAGALFSMTLGPVTNPLHKQILKTFATNRNFIKCSDYAKCADLLLHGPEKIISALRHQPATTHKLKLLDVDVLYSTDNMFCVAIQGPFMFRKCSVQPLWFNRTLIVSAKEDNEYCITNDQYHIDNLSITYNINEIEDLKNCTDKAIPNFYPITFSTAEKNQLLKLLHELTTMQTDYCNKYLKDSNWDIRSAINLFMDHYVANKIPTEAFRR